VDRRTGQAERLVDELGGLDRAVRWPSSARRSPRQRRRAGGLPPRQEFYELLSDQLSGTGESAAVSAWLNASLSKGEFDVLRSMRGPLHDVSTRRSPRADAVYVLTLTG
jgi:hypothetical protein